MPSDLRNLVYIAGPYEGSGNLAANVGRAMRMAHALMDVHLHPFCPHLCHFLELGHSRPRADWIAFDLAWLGQCDYLVRLSGESPGSDREVEEAHGLHIPVFYVVEDAYMSKVAKGIRASVDGRPVEQYKTFLVGR